MKNKLDIEKVLKFDKVFWRKLSQLIKKWIKKDMIAGKVQLNRGRISYSKQYAKYKANYMNRFTDGQKLKSLGGVSAKSNSQTPNMYLTGELINGLHYLRSTFTSMVMSYLDKDEDKLIYNQDLDIQTLNEPNMLKLKREFELGLDKSIRAWAKKKIIYTVGK